MEDGVIGHPMGPVQHLVVVGSGRAQELVQTQHQLMEEIIVGDILYNHSLAVKILVEVCNP